MGLAFLPSFLTNPAAAGSVVFSVAILLSRGGVRPGTGFGAPEFVTTNVLVAPIPPAILFGPASPLLVNRRGRA